MFQLESDKLKNEPVTQKLEGIITESEGDDVLSIFKVHEVNPVFKKLSSDGRLAGLARYLLNDKVYIHQSRLNYKPEVKGIECYWLQTLKLGTKKMACL